MILSLDLAGLNLSLLIVETYKIQEQIWKVAAAGPISNLLLAFISGLLLRSFNNFQILNDSLFLILIYFTQINISLAIFNLIPVSPLDGSQIFSGYLMKKNPSLAWKIQSYGPQVLVGIIIFSYVTGFSILWLIMEPFVNFFMFLFTGTGF